jgi:hypothetical protein
MVLRRPPSLTAAAGSFRFVRNAEVEGAFYKEQQAKLQAKKDEQVRFRAVCPAPWPSPSPFASAMDL